LLAADHRGRVWEPCQGSHIIDTAAQPGQNFRHLRARGKGVVAQAVTRDPASIERLFNYVGLGRQAHQHSDLVKGQAVPQGSAARIHGKETGARNLGLDLGGDEIRLSSLVCKNLAQDPAPRRRPWLQWAWDAIRGAFNDSSGQAHH
jgi:hypothetical protein